VTSSWSFIRQLRYTNCSQLRPVCAKALISLTCTACAAQPHVLTQDSSQYTRLSWSVYSAIHHIPANNTNNLNTDCLSINKILSVHHKPSFTLHVHNASDNHACRVVQRWSNKHFAYDELFVIIS